MQAVIISLRFPSFLRDRERGWGWGGGGREERKEGGGGGIYSNEKQKSQRKFQTVSVTGTPTADRKDVIGTMDCAGMRS